MHAYLGQERAGEGFAAGEVRVAQPDMLVARETPAGQPVAARKTHGMRPSDDMHRDRPRTKKKFVVIRGTTNKKSIDYPWPGWKA